MKLLRKRVLIPAALFLVTGTLFLVLVLRGTLASSETPRPSTSSEGALAQLWLTPEGRKVVRCAIVIDRPLDRVWGVVTGYAKFPEIFPTIRKAQSSVEADGRHRLRADVSASLLGTWPIDVLIRHEEKGDVRVASWDQPTGDVLKNAGSWTLTKVDDQRTLVEYLLDVEISGYPDWFVRAILRGRQRGILRALDEGARR
ncbi:MAG TPA: SRPBCC family protein [Planctomycetota bacterium]